MSTSNVDDLVVPDLSQDETFLPGIPHAAFRALRDRPGLYWQPTSRIPRGGYWAVARFEDIVAIEKDLSAFTSTQGGSFPVLTTGPAEGAPTDNLMMNDPPRHTGLRRLAAAGFGPRIIAKFDPWIRDIVREVIEDVRHLEEFDYIEKFARTIPAYVIARVLGVPDKDREKLVDWTLQIFATDLAPEEGSNRLGNLEDAFKDMYVFAAELSEVKRQQPEDDMFSVMVKSLDAGEMTMPEFIQWMSLMMAAGFETTHTAIGQSMRMYLEDPAVRIATNRALAENNTARMADEYIRVISPVIQMARTATRDVEIAGTLVAKNDPVVLYFVSANRDGAVFSDPDTFNPWREETATLAFGSGVHRCLGSYLAKLEVQIVFEELRASGLTLRLSGDPERGASAFINQLRKLPVALTS
ncbi:MAG: cytochrome P450 [Mycetocola sp.]